MRRRLPTGSHSQSANIHKIDISDKNVRHLRLLHKKYIDPLTFEAMYRLPRHRATVGQADGRFGGDRREPHTAEKHRRLAPNGTNPAFLRLVGHVTAPVDLRTQVGWPSWARPMHRHHSRGPSSILRRAVGSPQVHTHSPACKHT